MPATKGNGPVTLVVSPLEMLKHVLGQVLVTSGNDLHLKFFHTYSFPFIERNKFKSGYGLNIRFLNHTLWGGGKKPQKHYPVKFSFSPRVLQLAHRRASTNLLEQGSFNYTTSFQTWVGWGQ